MDTAVKQNPAVLPPNECDHSLPIKYIAFCNEYICNGFNATQAWLKISPKSAYKVACQSGIRLLDNPKVQDYIHSKLDNSMAQSIAKRLASKEKLIIDAHHVYDKSLKDNKLQVALNAIDQKARLNHLYEREQADLAGYGKLMQALQVNVNVNTQSKQEDSTVTVVTEASDLNSEGQGEVVSG